jgi:ORF6N domain
MKKRSSPRISITVIENRICLIRGMRVMLDMDLAVLYGVPTKALNQAVSRNLARFPADFMFRLTRTESAHLMSQFVTSSFRHGGPRKLPRCFTEQGVAMLSSVLRSPRAIAVNIAVMRAFVHLRELIVSHADLSRKIEEMERRYDGKFASIFEAIKELIGIHQIAQRSTRRIGFQTNPIEEPKKKGRSFRTGRLYSGGGI